ncbi:ABC transporter substrate-binding protein [Anaerovorax odorimutans]|uniref:ABC transporter substrate-binding protein n=1 Tax=Anaerovorax odorimutans TaxID=109327 RepID=UPI0004064722|nr:ABC transporter substrate-binding protein [Anaerovorax odorimutans]
MKLNKIGVIVLILALVVGTFAGCGSDTKGDTDEKVLVYGSGDYTSINPALYEHGEINSLIFTGLTAHNSENKVVPSLAKSWDYDEGSYTYTFHLRDDVTFHDGKPFTAEDVKFTLETIMNPDNGSEIASNYEDITSVDIVDDYTVKISMKAPNVAMLDYLTIGILPKHLLEGKDIITDDFNQKPIGTGPFMLSNWDKGQSITLEKYDDFYLGAAKLDKVIFKIVEDYDARALQLKSGELDLAQVTPKAAKEFENKDGFKLNIMKTADYRGIMYNFNNPLFGNNKELPKAFSYAIDRQAIVDSVLLGHGEVAYSPLQISEYNNPNIEKYEYNPEKAKQILEEAGWIIGDSEYYEKDGKELGFTINNKQGDQVRVDMSNICAQNLQDIGVNAKVEVNSKIDWANQDSFLVGWGSPFDPDDHTYKVFGTDKGSNYNGYSNKKVDEILQKARETEDFEARLPLYEEFQKELSNDPPYTFIAYIDAMYVSKEGVTGITPETVLGHHGVGIFWNIQDWDIK